MVRINCEKKKQYTNTVCYRTCYAMFIQIGLAKQLKRREKRKAISMNSNRYAECVLPTNSERSNYCCCCCCCCCCCVQHSASFSLLIISGMCNIYLAAKSGLADWLDCMRMRYLTMLTAQSKHAYWKLEGDRRILERLCTNYSLSIFHICKVISSSSFVC